MTGTNEGESSYHAMQLSLERRFARGYTFNVSYTWSRFEEAIAFLNPDDPAPARTISEFDSPHRVVLSGILEIPLGRGRRFGSQVHPVVDRIIGGWQISGIYQFQTGRPVNNFGNLLLNGSAEDIGIPNSERTLARWFNVDAFNRVAAQQLASNVRTFPFRFDSVRLDDINNVDLSLIKNTSVAGRVRAQLRLEALNAFNHPQFPTPNITATQAAFGSIVPSTQENYARRVQAMIKVLF